MISGVLYALLAGLMWGLIFVGPLLVPENPAMLQSTGRYLALGLIALPLAWLGRGRLRQLSRQDWWTALGLTMMGNLIYYACLASAIQRTGAPVAVSPLRSDAVKSLLSAHDLQIIVTDDGLQHYKLARDREIVVIDGVRRFGNGWWLPAGPMRERASRLQSVDAVIVNGGVARPGEIPMRLRPGMAVNLLTGERRDVSTFTNVVAMAGIGHPPRFFATLESCGVQPVKTVALADHQALSQADVAALVTAGQTLLMTEKDAVKCRDFAAANWWYLPVDAIMADERAQRLLADLAMLAQR